MSAPKLQRGDGVVLTVDQRTVPALVGWASHDAGILMLFSTAASGHSTDMVPVMWSEGEASYVDLLLGETVIVTPQDAWTGHGAPKH